MGNNKKRILRIKFVIDTKYALRLLAQSQDDRQLTLTERQKEFSLMLDRTSVPGDVKRINSVWNFAVPIFPETRLTFQLYLSRDRTGRMFITNIFYRSGMTPYLPTLYQYNTLVKEGGGWGKSLSTLTDRKLDEVVNLSNINMDTLEPLSVNIRDLKDDRDFDNRDDALDANNNPVISVLADKLATIHDPQLINQADLWIKNIAYAMYHFALLKPTNYNSYMPFSSFKLIYRHLMDLTKMSKPICVTDKQLFFMNANQDSSWLAHRIISGLDTSLDPVMFDSKVVDLIYGIRRN